MIKKILPLLLLLTISFSSTAQLYLDKVPDDLFKKANTAKDVDYLTDDEKLVILYMNLARLDGLWFIKNIVDNQEDKSSNLKSLKVDLRKSKNLAPLKPAKGLSDAASYHAKDMGEHGTTGHQSSDGTTTFTRIKKFAKGGFLAENCSYGPSDPLAIVLQLLIDEGVSTLGHRKTILSENYSFVGVSIQPHSAFHYNCVQDFSDTGD